jgi:hypothetical protein
MDNEANVSILTLGPAKLAYTMPALQGLVLRIRSHPNSA